ncbi:protein-export chaperone SecB [Globicatella sulfidifaciens]|uniref:Preprotein translocase subunit SecB n=1 Tax=Globicatella sulfidifaciens TaxID=136093 RepID=A0A7X8C3L3_9LACT|nr:protein-export chaperone SecB [Globicatella sulfidifaciens]NLJ18365.1 hypothetical protein [Globicatella sulfidifaciens]
MGKLTLSEFQFKNPELINVSFNINDGYDKSEFTGITLNSTTEVSKTSDTNDAFVQLNLEIGDDHSPFYIGIKIKAKFNWNEEIDEQVVDKMLSYNAPALLLGYIRPMVSTITSWSKYPAYNIPFIDFRPTNDGNIKEDSGDN